MVTNARGEELERVVYTPFGGTVEATTAPEFGFTGQRFEADLGLYDYGARWYDPQIGRFMSPDAVVADPFSLQDFNRYTYVRNSPSNYVDPSGNFSEWAGGDYFVLGGQPYRGDYIRGVDYAGSQFDPVGDLPASFHDGFPPAFPGLPEYVFAGPGGGIDVEAFAQGLAQDLRDIRESYEQYLRSQSSGSISRPTGGNLISNVVGFVGLEGPRGIVSGVRATFAANEAWADDVGLQSGAGGLEFLAGPPTTRVYQGIRAGKAVYVGITNNLARRGAQHAGRFGIEAITPQAVSRGQARAIEQALMNRNPGFENKINSISRLRSYYNEAVRWGEAWLKSNGF